MELLVECFPGVTQVEVGRIRFGDEQVKNGQLLARVVDALKNFTGFLDAAVKDRYTGKLVVLNEPAPCLAEHLFVRI